ncbi:MAG: 50S ribosomal protein L11 methyltransferase, partial [Ginsengibacter sp.]
ILAEKLGAAEVIAIDNDEWSINNAIENIEINNSRNIKVQYKNSLDDLNAQDIILANINLNVLTTNVQKICLMSKHRSLLLLSGFFIEDEVALLNIYSNFGFVKTKEKRLEGWSSLLLCKE